MAFAVPTLIKCVTVLVAFNLFGYLGGTLANELNFISPLSLLIATSWAFFVTVRKYSVSAWTPYLWFIASSGAFFGMGPLVYVLGNDASIEKLSGGRYAITAEELLRTNLVNSVGILAALLVFYMLACNSARAEARKNMMVAGVRSRISVETVALYFLIFGGILRYGFILPARFGLSGLQLPGTVMSAANLFDLGLAAAAYLAVRKKGFWQVIVVALLAVHLSTCLLEFSKRSIVLALLMTGLGAFLGHRNKYRFSVWLLVAGVSIYILQPFAIFGRLELQKQNGFAHLGTLSQRVGITKRYLNGERTTQRSSAQSEEIQGGWLRLTYAGPQAVAMRLFDQGKPGTSIRQAWTLPIPRAVWPNKPTISPGADFYYMLTGRKGTAVGITVYADGYFQFGWIGVICFGAVLGAVFVKLSALSLRAIQNEDLIYLPVVFLALRMAMLGTTSFLLNGILGPLPIYFGYILVTKIFTKQFGTQRSST